MRIYYVLRDKNILISEIQILFPYRDEEEFWKQKSRNKWLQAGDRNTIYFHRVTKVRKIRNCIKKIFDNHGISHRKDETIAKVAEEYFQGMFSTSNPISMEEIFDDVQKKVTNDMNAMLIRPVTYHEIKEVVFFIGADRAPGLDGFTAAFYQQFWKKIGEDVCIMV